MDITIVLPILNEKDNILPLLKEIENTFTSFKKTFEVIAVDDHSTDGTRELLADLQKTKPYLHVIYFRKNAGQSAAFDAGFRHAKGKTVVTMDADLQNDPNDIPKMVAMLDEGFDFITGWRKNRKDGFILRTFPSKIANYIIRKVTKTKLHDMGCSLKVYRKEITDDIQLYGEMHRFISVFAEGLGARTTEMVVNHRKRHAGVSKYGIKRTFKVILDLLTVWFIQGYQTKPIYVFGGFGFLLLSFGVLSSAFVLYQKFILDIFVHRNPLFILSMISAIIGVQFIALGLIAEIIIRTYFESQKKSSYHIEKKLGF